MTRGTNKILGRLYWPVIVAIVLINVIPLAGEYLFTMHGWKSYFLDFHLVDEQGRSHSGLMGLGSISLVDGEIFQYGFETGGQGAVKTSASRRKRGRSAAVGAVTEKAEATSCCMLATAVVGDVTWPVAGAAPIRPTSVPRVKPWLTMRGATAGISSSPPPIGRFSMAWITWDNSRSRANTREPARSRQAREAVMPGTWRA